MSSNNNHQFLLSAVSNAEDLQLLSNKYNLGLSDSVLRGGVEFDDRTLVIYGSKKRNEMCQKKLPKLLDSMDKHYDPDKFIYLTEANLKEFVDNELAIIKGNAPEPSEVVAEESPKQITLDKAEEKNEDNLETITGDTVEPKEVLEESKSLETVEGVVVPKPIIQHHQVGSSLCQYGVPKMIVEYQQPNVLGLQESLFVNVEEETIKQFFSTVKERVLANANEGI